MPHTKQIGDEQLAELVGLDVERVDLVGSPAIRRRFFLTKSKAEASINQSLADWANLSHSDYSIDQMIRACPTAIRTWAAKQATTEKREIVKSDLMPLFREPDGRTNYWGIRAALEQLPVTDFPAVVKSEAETELRKALEAAEQELGREDGNMPKTAKVTEDIAAIASRMSKEDKEENLAGIRREAKTLIDDLRKGLESGEIEADTVEAAITELEASMSDEGVSKEELESSIAELRELLPGKSEEEEAVEEAETTEDETASEDVEASETEKADETTEDDGEAEETSSEDTSADEVETEEAEKAEAEVEAETDEPETTEATEDVTEEEEVAKESEEATEETEEEVEPIEQAEGLSEEEQSTLLRALQACAGFKDKLGGAFESMASMVGYKTKSAEPVDIEEVETLLKSEQPESIRKALQQYVAIAKHNETLTAALELERTEKADIREKLTKAEEAELDRSTFEKAQKVALIGVENTALAAFFKKLHMANPELEKEAFEVFKSANGAIKASGLLDVIGTTAVAPDSPLGRIHAIAKSIEEESGGQLSFAQAKAKAWKENPEIANEYAVEHREAQGR